MSGKTNGPRTTMEDWMVHYEDCNLCKPYRPCAAGALILEAAIDTTAELIAPVPMMAKGQA